MNRSLIMIIKRAMRIGIKSYKGGWLEDEDNILRNALNFKDAQEKLKEYWGEEYRTTAAIEHRFARLGVKLEKSRLWSYDEVKLLKELFSLDNLRNGVIRKAFPNKTQAQIRGKIRKLGLTYNEQELARVREEFSGKKKVRNITTGEVFDSVKEAKAKYHGIKSERIGGTTRMVNGCYWEYIDKEGEEND